MNNNSQSNNIKVETKNSKKRKYTHKKKKKGILHSFLKKFKKGKKKKYVSKRRRPSKFRFLKYLLPTYWIKVISHPKLTLDGISRADLWQNVPGLGKKKVDRILESREQGKILSIDDVILIDGVGPEDIKQLRSYLIDKSKVPDLLKYIVSTIFALVLVGFIILSLSLASHNLLLRAELIEEKSKTLETKIYALAIMKDAIMEKTRDQEIISQLILKENLKDITDKYKDSEKLGLDDMAIYKLLVENHKPVDSKIMDIRILYDDDVKYRNQPVMLVSYDVYSELKSANEYTQVVIEDYEFVFISVQPSNMIKSGKVVYIPAESGTEYFNFILTIVGDRKKCTFYSVNLEEEVKVDEE